MARGRKSEASLTVVPLLPGQGRPPAPRDLDRRERRVWRAVVGALPAHWLDPAGQQVLRRLVAQAVICERREARLRELRAQGQDGSEEADALATLHSTSAKTLGQLLGLLRATPRSRVVSRDAGPKVEEAPKSRPWEIKRVASPTVAGPQGHRRRRRSPSSRLACSSLRASTSEKPLALQAWQKDWIRTVYDNPAGTRRAILSTPRKNAKTALSAALLLAHLCGPPARNRPNSQLFSAAQSRDQAAIIFSLAAKMVRMNRDLAQAVVVRETAKELLCPELGTKYKALSAEASTAFGLSPALIIFDELGQVRGPRSSLYEALETATAAQASPLSIIISTQAPTDADLLSILIDDALAGHDPHTVVKLYSASTDLDPFAEATIRLANPAFDAFMNQREVLAMAADAKRMPAREAEYRNLVLNQRVEVNNPFISQGVWNACGTPVGSARGP